MDVVVTVNIMEKCIWAPGTSGAFVDYAHMVADEEVGSTVAAGGCGIVFGGSVLR